MNVFFWFSIYIVFSSHVSLVSSNLHFKKFLFSRARVGPRKVSFLKASQMHGPH